MVRETILHHLTNTRIEYFIITYRSGPESQQAQPPFSPTYSLQTQLCFLQQLGSRQQLGFVVTHASTLSATKSSFGEFADAPKLIVILKSRALKHIVIFFINPPTQLFLSIYYTTIIEFKRSTTTAQH